jgi:spermidine synthase
LRRRLLPSLDDIEVYEIILGDAFLMTSLFTEVEQALSRLGLAAAKSAFPGQPLDVVVGGLGLGYTARAALEFPETGSLIVVDFLEAVIDWHQRGLVPLGPGLTADARCRLVHADFFKLALSRGDEPGFDPLAAGRRYHAVLLDIDHSPSNLLHQANSAFYTPEGLRALTGHLHPGGVFALWSDDPPDEVFMASLTGVFVSCEAHVVRFPNPHQNRQSASTVYVAVSPSGPRECLAHEKRMPCEAGSPIHESILIACAGPDAESEPTTPAGQVAAKMTRHVQ